MTSLSSALANLFVLSCLVGSIYLIWYIQGLTGKIRDLRRKEKENEINQEIQKELESIRVTPLADLIAKANAKFRKLRGQGSDGGE